VIIAINNSNKNLVKLSENKSIKIIIKLTEGLLGLGHSFHLIYNISCA